MSYIKDILKGRFDNWLINIDVDNILDHKLTTFIDGYKMTIEIEKLK